MTRSFRIAPLLELGLRKTRLLSNIRPSYNRDMPRDDTFRFRGEPTERYRSPAEKLLAGLTFYAEVMELKFYKLRRLHPEWTDEAIDAEVYKRPELPPNAGYPIEYFRLKE